MKRYFVILSVLWCLAAVSCVHKKIDDPVPSGNSVFNIIIEGSASPSTLYIPKTLIRQVTTITVKVTSADHLPLGGREIVFQQYDSTGTSGIGWGYFEGDQLSIKKQLDSEGTVRINYYFPGAYTVGQNTTINIRATLLQNDLNRIVIYDLIPVYIVVYAP